MLNLPDHRLRVVKTVICYSHEQYSLRVLKINLPNEIKFAYFRLQVITNSFLADEYLGGGYSDKNTATSFAQHRAQRARRTVAATITDERLRQQLPIVSDVG